MDEGALKLETELKGTQDHSFRNRKTRNELGGESDSYRIRSKRKQRGEVDEDTLHTGIFYFFKKEKASDLMSL